MMKSIILTITLLAVSVGILAQVRGGTFLNQTTRTANAPATTAEQEIRQLLERYYEIARTNDRAALKEFSREISADGYRYSSELGVMDKAAAIRYFDALDLEFVAAEFDELTVQVHGETAAVAKYRDVSTVRTNGVLTKKPLQFTNFWVKENGAWKIAAEHSSFAAPRELLPRSRFADDVARK